MSSKSPFTSLLQLNTRQRCSGSLRDWGFVNAVLATFTALCFVLLVSTASTHHHASSLEDQTCSLCSAVGDKFSDVPPVTAPTVSVLLELPYQLVPLAAQASLPAFPRLLPHSCGPPALPFSLA